MNKANRSHILQSLGKGIRYDGRKLDEYRDITVEYGISKTAEGSAKVTIGKTVVLAGVKMSIDKPYPDTPDQGGLMVNAELLPLSNPNFEPGPPTAQSIELARVVDRGIREAKAIDVKKLCIEPGEKVWTVIIDVISMNDDGNLFDAASLAALAAIRDARFPAYDGVGIDYKTKTEEKIPLAIEPLAVTVLKIGEHFVIDPLSDEEEVIDARLTVTSTEDGNLCALQKGGEATFSDEEITKIVDMALEKASMLRSKL